MKSIILISFLAALLFSGVNDIATINRLKKEAAQAYQNGNFSEAIARYQILVDSFNIEDEHLKLNLANAYFQSRDTSTAYNYYRQLLNSNNQQVKSAAFQQMGVIDDQKKNQKQALAYFKEALKASPTNEDARYNYELLKKTLKDQEQNQDQNKKDQEKQENKDQQQKNQDQQNQEKQDQQNQDEQQQEGKEDQEQNKNDQQDQQQSDEKKEDQEPQKNEQQQGEQEQSDEDQQNEEQPANPTTAERLKEMNMSEEKARMILEAMRNNEQQYIQQIKRKAQKPADRSKPDW